MQLGAPAGVCLSVWVSRFLVTCTCTCTYGRKRDPQALSWRGSCVAFVRFCSVILTSNCYLRLCYIGSTGRWASFPFHPPPASIQLCTTCECGDMGMISNLLSLKGIPTRKREGTVDMAWHGILRRTTDRPTGPQRFGLSCVVFCWSLHVASLRDWFTVFWLLQFQCSVQAFVREGTTARAAPSVRVSEWRAALMRTRRHESKKHDRLHGRKVV
jgi:hypothetical protein